MSDLTHFDESGRASMVNVSAKEDTERVARASGTIRMERDTLEAIEGSRLGKGEVLAVARIAGIMAAKRTAEIIPLCHPIALSDIRIDITLDKSLPGLRVESTVRCVGKTGVEMEALTAVSAALLTVYDMAKARDKGMVISDVMLLEKSGGRSGHWNR